MSTMSAALQKAKPTLKTILQRKRTPFIDCRDDKTKSIIRFHYSKKLDRNEPLDKIHKLIKKLTPIIQEEIDQREKKKHCYISATFKNLGKFFQSNCIEEDDRDEEQKQWDESLEFSIIDAQYRIRALKHVYGPLRPTGFQFEYVVEDLHRNTLYVGVV